VGVEKPLRSVNVTFFVLARFFPFSSPPLGERSLSNELSPKGENFSLLKLSSFSGVLCDVTMGLTFVFQFIICGLFSLDALALGWLL